MTNYIYGSEPQKIDDVFHGQPRFLLSFDQTYCKVHILYGSKGKGGQQSDQTQQGEEL